MSKQWNAIDTIQKLNSWKRSVYKAMDSLSLSLSLSHTHTHTHTHTHMNNTVCVYRCVNRVLSPTNTSIGPIFLHVENMVLTFALQTQ